MAGDVYDRAAPVDEAVALLDYFVSKVSERKIPLLMIAGNHDSGQKLSFANSILERQEVYIEGVLKKQLNRVRIKDEYGWVNFYLLPYFFPALVNQVFDCGNIKDYGAACSVILENQSIDTTERNIIIAHQSITRNNSEAERDGSETTIGGVGNMDYTIFDAFDYAALGHIHMAQKVGRNEVRYPGSPIAYHFYEYEKTTAEKYNDKGPLLIDIGEKGTPLKITKIDIPTLHKVRVLKGKISEIIDEIEDKKYSGDYIKIIITDTKPDLSVRADLSVRIETFGSELLETVYRPVVEYSSYNITEADNEEEISLFESFMNFYSESRDGEMPDIEDEELIKFIADTIDNSTGTLSIDTIADKALSVLTGGCTDETT